MIASMRTLKHFQKMYELRNSYPHIIVKKKKAEFSERYKASFTWLAGLVCQPRSSMKDRVRDDVLPARLDVLPDVNQ